MTWYDYITLFAMGYPSLMALLWIFSGLYYFITHEWRRADDRRIVAPAPMVTVMVPCYNEAANIDETVGHLLSLNYPNYEILLINDGSRDDTAALIDAWAAREPKVRALHQINQGKATALNNGLTQARGEILVCIDGDAVLDYDALIYMVQTLQQHPQAGAVTGNPRVRNRSTILGHLQVAEFSSIIGLIKRSQSLSHTIFTISGVIGAFRRDAMRHVGGWSGDMMTEDIDVSWKLQLADYDVIYEPRALCWVLMPETIKGLFNQRMRWAQGGAEVMGKYMRTGWRWRHRRFWPLFAEYFATATWTYVMSALLLLVVYDQALHPNLDWHVLRATSFLILCVCVLQFVVSVFIDGRYEPKLWRSFVWCIWYPIAYWLLNLITMALAIPKAIFRKRGRLATWVSPDRGVQ